MAKSEENTDYIRTSFSHYFADEKRMELIVNKLKKRTKGVTISSVIRLALRELESHLDDGTLQLPPRLE